MSNENAKIELFVPGRLCLLGEHSDWAGAMRAENQNIVPGRAIVTGIEQGIYGVAKKSDKLIVTSNISQYKGKSFSAEMDVDVLKEEAKSGSFFSYIAGVASYILENYNVGGIHLEITKMDLPMKVGLSSSAAICVMVAKAFDRLYKLEFDIMDIMNVAYLGEKRTPSCCGKMDQACAFGVGPVDMIFDVDQLNVEPIFVKNSLHYVMADLMASKDTVTILNDLNMAYPVAHNDMESALHEALGEDNYNYTSKAREYIESGDVEALGRIMVEAQANFDKKVAPMSPVELKSPVLHQVLSDENIKQLTYGGKGVGSQGDGTVQFLAKNEECQDKLIEYLEKEKGMKAFKFTIPKTNAVKKAVIPVAGFGTRLYPETRGVKKEFCPVVDADGLVKPAIMVLLEELDRVGIEQICLILNPGEEEYYKDFFFKPLSQEHFAKLPDNMKEYEVKIKNIASKLSFVYQREQNGFGHAVYQSKDFADGDAVLLLLGDTIYQSNTDIPCTKQLINVYEKYAKTVVAVHSVELDEVVHYGIFSGKWRNSHSMVMNLENIVEKPDCQTAEEQLKMITHNHEEVYYAAFGAYIINSEIYDRLKYAIDNNIANAKGEIELTDALEFVRNKSGMLAFVPDGESFDLGNADAYRKTVAEFGLK